MILRFRINTIEMLNLDDGGKLLQLGMTDASKPVSMRSSATFVNYMSLKARKDLPDGDLTDTDVTMIVREMGGAKGGGVKVKGQMIPGIKTDADMEKKFGAAVDFSAGDYALDDAKNKNKGESPVAPPAEPAKSGK